MGGGRIYSHGVLGDVVVTTRANARRIVARWKGGVLHVTVPPLTSKVCFESALDDMAPQLLSRRPGKSLYEFGREMNFGEFAVGVVGVEAYGRRCTLHGVGEGLYEIRVDKTMDLAATASTAAISRLMDSVAKFLAPRVLLPMAKGVSERLGAAPKEWKISSGKRTLGRCTARGVISLSRVLVFAPVELREYVVCHELAHLSEMNHSARFHAVCNRYCGGRERELERGLKAFRFPLV